MPVRRLMIAAIAAAPLFGCATPAPAPEPEGADRLDAEVRSKVRAGRDRGYPDLSDVPAPGATPAEAAALAGEADALATEAEALRALRDRASAPRPSSDLPQRAARLRREVAAARAELAAQPPIEPPAPPSR